MIQQHGAVGHLGHRQPGGSEIVQRALLRQLLPDAVCRGCVAGSLSRSYERMSLDLRSSGARAINSDIPGSDTLAHPAHSAPRTCQAGQ